MGDINMRKMQYLFYGIASSVILLILAGGALSTDNPVVVNLMIDINAPPSPTSLEEQIAFDSIVNLTNGIGPKGLNVTLFPIGEAIPSQRLRITYLANSSNYEVAMGGMKKDEKIGSNSSSDQRALLGEMKRYVEACHICSGKETKPLGFKPQSFDQNADTYQILNQMGMLYDAGFKAGVLYLPDHENDTWPYRMNNQNLYAVPVSTYALQGDRILLSDRIAKEEEKLSGSQWYDILESKFEESAKKGDPVVLIFDNQITGRDADYLKAYLDFIDYALSKNATFVTTSELVKMSKTKKPASASSGMEAAMSSSPESGCIACDTLENATLNATFENKTASADMVVGINPNFKD
jgi:hypothetical protein